MNRIVITLLRREYHRIREEEPQKTDRDIYRDWGVSERQFYRYKELF
jgi:putative heme degradation protein